MKNGEKAYWGLVDNNHNPNEDIDMALTCEYCEHGFTYCDDRYIGCFLNRKELDPYKCNYFRHFETGSSELKR